MNEMSLTQFLEKLASKDPVPGGGGAAALAGAIGVALGNMVGSLTVGKKKYAAVEKEIIELNEKAEMIRERLCGLIVRDAEVFEPLAKAYGIPKDDPTRDEVMEKVLREASEVPLEIMRNCCAALELIEEYAQKGSAIAISDAGCAAVLCRAALESAALNVYINTKSMKNRELAEKMNGEVKELMDRYCAMASDIYTSVSGRLN